MDILEYLDKEKTEKIGYYGNDILIVRNPKFKYRRQCPYTMDCVLAVLCDEGKAEGRVNFEPYRVERNGFMIILSGHIVEALEESPDFKGVYIFMSEQFLSRLDIGDSYKFYENVERRAYFPLEERTANSIRLYAEMTLAMLDEEVQNPNKPEALRLLTKLFFLMAGWFIHNEAVSQEVQLRSSVVMCDFLALLKTHYREHREVAYYADRMHMTPKYMSMLIRKASGKSALQWIENYVILDAKARLGSTTNSIQQICYDLNFPSQSFFGRYFKRSVGMSPSEYRRMVRCHAVE